MKWTAHAPSNIALIKYMGKLDETTNLPSNPSLSYTLNHLLSYVELELAHEADKWEPLIVNEENKQFLNSSQQAKFIKHLNVIKNKLGFSGHFIIRSGNNFPMGTGLASSASSFAALTTCAVTAISEILQIPMLDQTHLALLSRQGSGSSCRSFFKPWALWDKDKVSSIDLPYASLIHRVVVVSKDEKEVSSREAHNRVISSPLFEGRFHRATSRLNNLIHALSKKDWKEAYIIVWEEFEDMHKLFETSAIPFSYMTKSTHEILEYLRKIWYEYNDGPLVTLDAGPNIHLLFRNDQKELISMIETNLKINSRYNII